MPKYDADLFAALNAEYAAKRAQAANGKLFPPARQLIYDREAETGDADKNRRRRTKIVREVCDRASERAVPEISDKRLGVELGRVADKLRAILTDVELADKHVIEIGCGLGTVTKAIVDYASAKTATGLDIAEKESWRAFQGPQVRYICGDLSRGSLLPANSADAVVSSVVMEHVSRPVQMLRAIYDVLRPGGLAWLRFNLYRGWNASHLYDVIHFPWPHLLFEAEVCAQYFQEHHGRPRRYSWVNRMTIMEYLTASVEAGFRIDLVELIRSPMDLEFYRRFEDKLGRYPALDLRTPFMKMVLCKTGETPGRFVPIVGFQQAQQELDAQLATLG